MTATGKLAPSNQLINSLSAKARSRVLQRCETVELPFGTILNETGQKISHVYFPVTGFISLLVIIYDHLPLVTGLIGNEGMLGATLMLGVSTAPTRAVVQGPGVALRMKTSDFRHEIEINRPLQLALNRYLYVLITRLSQNVACTHFHKIEERLARWLLMTHDRAQADHFYLTHAYLASILGVRRSGITVAAGALQLRKLISYNRGEICILDREGLELASCACYSQSRKVITTESL